MPDSIITIEQHLLDQQRDYPHATGEFTSLMYDIALAAKMIVRETTRAGLVDILGQAGSTNVQGEEQQKLDIFAHNVLVRTLQSTGRVAIMGSEEEPDPIVVEPQNGGSYAILFDPLDGSSNIAVNIPVGTIFSIYRRLTPSDQTPNLSDLLQPGVEQVAAGYVVYSSSTMLVYTAGHGVYGFTLDPTIGEFLLSHEKIRFPESPKYYSINSGYRQYWSEGISRYIALINGLDDGDFAQKPLSHRYVGSMVADFHRMLMGGGVFMYPADSRNPDLPYGKLRLCYECIPMAFIAEQAGGAASDGVQDISGITPYDLHQRVPFFGGSTSLVRRLEEVLAAHDGAWLEGYQAQLTSQPG